MVAGNSNSANFNSANFRTETSTVSPHGEFNSANFNIANFRIDYGDYSITGVTRDKFGQPLGTCTLYLFRVDTLAYVMTTTSDANGNYTFSFTAALANQYFIRGIKAGVPDYFASSDNVQGSY